MRRVAPYIFASTVLGGCAVNMGAPEEIPVTTAAVRVEATATAASMAAALDANDPRVSLLLASQDDAWFRAVAEAAGGTLSGPGRSATGLGMAFLGLEPLGDTAIDLRYEGGRFTLQDALYDLDEQRFLDLLAFEVADAAAARPLITALLEYVATDVEPSAAVIMAVAVPSEAVGDSVARMLSPGFDDATRCDQGAESAGDGLRLFYGPEARIFCRESDREATAVGEWTRARLIMGRR